MRKLRARNLDGFMQQVVCNKDLLGVVFEFGHAIDWIGWACVNKAAAEASKNKKLWGRDLLRIRSVLPNELMIPEGGDCDDQTYVVSLIKKSLLYLTRNGGVIVLSRFRRCSVAAFPSTYSVLVYSGLFVQQYDK